MTARRIVYQFGVPSTLLLIFGEQFTGTGVQTQFQLTGAAINATFTTGEWNADQVKTTLPVEVTGTDYKPTYDSIIPFTRHRVAASGVSAAGLVTLDYPPRNGVNFYVWYWYDLESEDLVDEYWRNDFVASMEQESGAHGSTSLYDTNSSNILSLYWNEDDTVDRSLDIYVGGANRTLCLAPYGLRAYDSNGFKIWADDSTTLGLHITDTGALGLAAAWDNTFGNDLSTARVYTTQTITAAWDSTRTGLVRIIDCLRLPAGTYGVNYNTFQLHNSVSVATAVTVARTIYLAQYYHLRNFDLVGTDDSGTLANLIGFAFSYGHFNTNTSATPVTTTVYGINLTPYQQCGTVTTSYDFRIASPNITGGRTPVIGTAHYPISQEAGDDSITAGKTRNYFNARTGFKTTDPQGVVEIEDAGTAYTQLLKITQDDANVYGLVIGNDTYSTTDTVGLRLSVGNTGISTIEHYTTGSLRLEICSHGHVNNDIYLRPQRYVSVLDYDDGTNVITFWPGGVQISIDAGSTDIQSTFKAANSGVTYATFSKTSGTDGTFPDALYMSNFSNTLKGYAVCQLSGEWYFNPEVGIMTTTPVCRLEIEDSATAASMLVKITQDDANTYGLIIGNDTYSTTDTLGIAFCLLDDGSGRITNFGAGSLTINAAGTANTSDLYLRSEDHIYFQDYNAAVPIAWHEFNMQTGDVGIGGGDTANQRLTVTQGLTNTSGSGIQIYSYQDVTSNGTYYARGLQALAYVNTSGDKSANNLGYHKAVESLCFVRENAGTIAAMYGIENEVGSYGPAGADVSCTINSMYGIKSALFSMASTTVVDAYGLQLTFANFAGTHTGTTYGVYVGTLTAGATGKYAIYTQGSADKIYLASITGVGIATSAPVASLEIEDGGTALARLLKLTQDDGNVFAIGIGNDTYSTNDALALHLWVGDTGNAAIANHGAGNLNLIAQGTVNTSDLYLIAEDKIYFSDSNAGTWVTRATFDATTGQFTGTTHSPATSYGFIDRAYVESRLENLVTNGSGLLSTNYNFTSWTFDAVYTHGGGGSFKRTTLGGTITSDEYIPVDPEKTYRLAIWAMDGEAGGLNYDAGNKQYFGVSVYDADLNMVSPQFYTKFSGATDTTLSEDLNIGDDHMHVTDTTGWQNAAGAGAYQRQMVWWPYTNALGYTYPNYTYSRYYSGNFTGSGYNTNGLWPVGGISGSTVTLTAVWPGPQLLAGTAVRNATSGGTYKYITLSNQTVPNAWTRYEGSIGTYDTTGAGTTTLIPYGTAYMKLLMLPNYTGTTSGTIRVSDIIFTEMAYCSPSSIGIISLNTSTLQQLGLGDKSIATSYKFSIGSTAPVAPLDMGASANGRMIAWGGTAGANWYGSIGTEYTNGDLYLLSGLKLNTAGAGLLYSWTGTTAPCGMYFDLSSGLISFFNDVAGSYTAGNTFSTAITKTKMSINSSGEVGIGTVPLASNRLYTYTAPTDPSTAILCTRIVNAVVQTTGAAGYTHRTLSVTYSPEIRAGATNNQDTHGILTYAMRNFIGAGTDESGTLSGLLANYVMYGHYNTNAAATPVTTTVYGLYLYPQLITGTINNLYDLYINTASAGGTLSGTHYAIYQADNGSTRACYNYYGATANGFRVAGNIATGVVEIEDGGTAQTILLKITQDDENTLGLVIGNDTATTADVNALQLYVSNTGTGFINHAGAGDLTFVARGTANASDMYFRAEDDILFQDYNAGTPSTKMTLDVITGNLGLGIAPNANYRLYSFYDSTDPADLVAGYVAQSQILYANTASRNAYGSLLYLQAAVAGTKTVTGNMYGAIYECERNHIGAATDDDGTLTGNLYGLYINIGHGSTHAAAAPVTSAFYGLVINPIYATGTVTTIYDLHLSSPTTGGTLSGTHYHLYQVATTGKNVLFADTGIGVAPSWKLHVAATLGVAATPTYGAYLDFTTATGNLAGHQQHIGLGVDLDVNAVQNGFVYPAYGIKLNVIATTDSDTDFTIGEEINVTANNSATVHSLYGSSINVTNNSTDAATAVLRGVFFYATTAQDVASINGIYGIAEATGGAVTTLCGAELTASYAPGTAKTCGTAIGALATVWAASADATITTAYGLKIDVSELAGTITTGYLIYGALTGTLGTEWGIYLTGETKNYFSGDVGIGVSPSYKLHVSEALSIAATDSAAMIVATNTGAVGAGTFYNYGLSIDMDVSAIDDILNAKILDSYGLGVNVNGVAGSHMTQLGAMTYTVTAADTSFAYSLYGCLFTVTNSSTSYSADCSILGIYGSAYNSAHADIGQIMAGYFLASGGASSGSVTAMYGVVGAVEYLASVAHTCTSATGGNFAVTNNHANATMTTAYGVSSRVTNTAGTLTTGYLYYGAKVGTVGTAWGIYLTGEAKNYLSNVLGIGMAPTAGLLQIGNGTNYSQFDGSGILTQTGTARINWTKKTAASVTIAAGGTDASSVVANLQTENDGNIFHLDEASGTPGIDFYVEFTSITAFNWVRIRGSYTGSASHALGILLYDWVAGAWKHKNDWPTAVYNTTAQQEVVGNRDFFVPSDTVFIGTGGDAGKVRIRFVHPMGGSASHDLYVDVVALYQ